MKKCRFTEMGRVGVALLVLVGTMSSLQAQDAEAWSAKGDEAVKLGQYQLGIDSYTRAIKESPETDRYYLLRAVADRFALKFKEFFEDVGKTLKLNPSNFEAYLLRASAYDQFGDCVDAAQDYTTAIAIQPQYAEAFYLRGMDNSKIGNFDQAISDFSVYLKATPGAMQGELGLAIAFEEKGDYQKAFDYYTSMLNQKPDAYGVYVLRASALDGLGRDDDALNDLALAQAKDPRTTNAYLTRGMIYMAKGKDAEAYQQVQLYIAKPNVAFSTGNMMPLLMNWILETERDHGSQMANRQLSGYLGQFMHNPNDWRVILASCLMNKASEEQVFQAVSKGDPTLAEFYLGMKHAVLGDKPGAISLLTEASKSKVPGQLEVRMAKARLALLQAGP